MMGEDAELTFEALSEWYDSFTRLDNYERWSEIIDELIRRAHPRGRVLLDVACGTGRSTEALHRRGYDVSGCELSSGMLRQARRKGSLQNIKLFQADMRNSYGKEAFDIINCQDDAINFIVDKKDLSDCFKAAYTALKPDGVYIFDCNTLKTYRTSYATTRIDSSVPGTVFAWEGKTSSNHMEGEVARAELTIFSELEGGGVWTKVDSPHVQRHHPPVKVKGLLLMAGFAKVSAVSLGPGGSLIEGIDEARCGKVIFVAQKAGEKDS